MMESLQHFNNYTRDILIVNEIFRYQQKWNRFFTTILIEAPFKLFEFQLFKREMQNLALEKDPKLLINLTKNTKEIAEKNVKLYYLIEETKKNAGVTKEVKKYRVQENGSLCHVLPAGYEKFDDLDTLQTFKNDELALYSDALVDFLDQVLSHQNKMTNQLETGNDDQPFREAGIYVNYTHSLESMKGQQKERWNEYLDKCKRDAEKFGNKVEEPEIKILRQQFIEKEIEIFTNFLTDSKVINDRLQIQLYLNDLKNELVQLPAGQQNPDTNSFPLTGNQAQNVVLCEALKAWIFPDHLTKFTNIEKELFTRGYIEKSYKWKKHKKDLIDFIYVVSEYGYFKKIVNGKKIKDFHIRHFISDRYGYGKTGLSAIGKKYKPKSEIAKIPYSWIEKPE